ncbi:MAG TPA: hypothetical protein VJ436_14265 [Anaerolineales bacterium]|nr:hypothetical protein [Anaerolineales bacterium]
MKTLTMLSHQISPNHPIFSQNGFPDLADRIQAVLPGFNLLPAEMIHDDVFLIQDRPLLTPTRRLVVLVPPGEIDENVLARRVWQLAATSCLSVLYLALSPYEAQTSYERRRLAILAAVTTDPHVRAHARVSARNDWPQVLEQTLRPGDLLVCLASHQVSEHFFRRRMLGERLAESVAVPVYLLGGFKIIPEHFSQQHIGELKTWIASFSVITVFLILQVSIDRSMIRPIATILLYLSVFGEAYLLLKINEWLG